MNPKLSLFQVLKGREIEKARTYNSKTFETKNTKWRSVSTIMGSFKNPYGEITTVFKVKPVHYIGLDGRWHDLSEIASYFGNKSGMILKEGWENKVLMEWLVWYQKRQQLIGGRGIWLPNPVTYFGFPIGRMSLPLILNASITVFPDPNPETSTVDGSVRRSVASEAWATIRGGTGTAAFDAGVDELTIFVSTSTTTNGYDLFSRGFFLFDTSAIGTGSTITAATLRVEGYEKVNSLTTSNARLAVPTTASNTGLALGDYDIGGWTTTAQATDIVYADWSITAYNTWTLNSTGLASISKTSITKFGYLIVIDADNTEPAWSSAADIRLFARTAEAAGTTSDPELSVTYTIPAFTPKTMIF